VLVHSIVMVTRSDHTINK